MADDDVAAVREFNRFYTNVLGLLREGLLDTPYSLTEARIIFELARAGPDRSGPAAPLARHRRRLPEPAAGQVRGRRDRAPVALRGRRPPPGHRPDRDRAGRVRQAGRAVGRADPRPARRAPGRPPGRPDRGDGRHQGDPRRHAPAADRGAPRAACPATSAGWCSATPRCTRRSTAGTRPTRRWSPGSSRTTPPAPTAPARRRGSPRWTGSRPAACSACARASRPRSCGCCWWSRRARPGHRRAAGRRVRRLRPAGGVPRDRAVDQRRAARRPPDLPAGRVRAVDSQPHHSFGHDLVGQDWRLPLR